MTKNYRITLYGIVTSLFWFSLYTYIPTFSAHLETSGISHKMIGIILGSYGFVQMLLRIPLGIFSDRINQRKIFVVMGMFLAMVSALGLWISNNVYVILFSRSLAGAAATTWVTYCVLFSSYFEKEESTKAIGIINSFTKIGQVAAMLLGGLLAQYFGQDASFMLAVVGGLLGLILSTGIVKNQEVKRKPLKIKELFSVIKETDLAKVSSLAVLVQLITFAITFGFLPIAASNIGANEFQLGMLITLTNVPAIFASALSGTFFVKRFGERNSLIVGFIVTALTTVVVPYINTLSLLFIVQIISGFARGLIYPILMGLSIKKVADNKRATAMGFFQAIYGLGMTLGPVMVGLISDFAGLTLGFWFTGLIGFIAAALSGIFIEVNTLEGS